MRYILGTYTQLPCGTSDEVYNRELDKQLKPLLTNLYTNPSNKILLRIGSGFYEWLEKKHPEINMLLTDLCRKNQVELLADSFYDGILPLIPAHERTSHLEQTITLFRKRFSKRTKGLWCYNQIFSPSLISAMESCGLEYLVISGYSQTQNTIIENKPFYMSEMGKQTVVFPTDDRFSKLVSEYSKSHDSSEKFYSELKKLSENTNNAVNVIMLNMDQLSNIENSSDTFKILFDTLGPNCTLPCEYLENHDLSRFSYLPYGIYGRDFNLGKLTSVNQLFIENRLLSKTDNILNLFREISKISRKNTDLRKQLETMIIEASGSGYVLNQAYLLPAVRNRICKELCEIEGHLAKLNLLPPKADLDKDNIPEYISVSKNCVYYLNTKGGLVSRLNFLPNMIDLVFHSEDGIFADGFRNSVNGKTVDLSSKRYEVTPLDKNGNDFFAKCPGFELDGHSVNLSKHYKFRQNSVIVEIEIENLSNEIIKDYVYESFSNLSFTDYPVNISSDEMAITSVISDPNLNFHTIFNVNEGIKTFIKQTETEMNGNKYYQYTQVKLQRKIQLNPHDSEHITVSLKTEKHR